MKFSIVTISFNQVRFIKESIESVINQSYKNYEYIIVDAGSTDGSRDIILNYKDNFNKIIFEEDNGPADGINKGFNNASGDIYCCLNSDDVLLPNVFEAVVKYFESTNADVICGNGYVINENSRIIEKIICDKITFKKMLYSSANFCQPSMFFKKEIYNKIGGFNQNNKSCWDLELLLDLSFYTDKIIKIDEYLSNFRLYKDSITGSQRFSDIQKENLNRLYRKYSGKDIGLYYHINRILYKIVNIVTNPLKYFYKYRYILFKH